MTYDQLFYLKLKYEKPLQEDCQYLIKKWQLNKPKIKKVFETYSNAKEFSQDYYSDLEFIINQSLLPQRFVFPLHNYLLEKKVLEVKSTKPVEIFIRHNPLKDSGKVILEISPDATFDDIEKVKKDINLSLGFLKKSGKSQKIKQPMRTDIDTAENILKNKDNIELVAESRHPYDGTKSVAADVLKERNNLKVFRSRLLKQINEPKRTSVSKRKEVEEYYSSIDPGF